LVNRDEFRKAMSKFATGVTVVTSVDEEGNPHSMTANSFTSVCMDPPTVLVCVAHGTHTHGYVEKHGRFGINVLREEQEDLGAYFARRPEDRTAKVDYSYSLTEDGTPILDQSMVFFSCKVIGSHVYGDHTIYLGEVKEVRHNEDGTPLMFYLSRWYHPTSG
jgi:3-hydroxy-9,10-secoandrosta-1,3,5(10)-triene-9,17-dione monooxygenase reductase component